VTSPIRAASRPAERKSASRAGAAGPGAASSRPPEVCASNRSTASSAGIAGSRLVTGPMQAVLARVPPETKPAAASSAAPGSSGTAAASIRAATWLAASIRCRWPSRPKPVTSVAARTPAASAGWLALALSWVMEFTAAVITSGGGSPRLSAVAITPVPIGLVKISWSPGAARSMVISAAGSARPTTARPYLGTGSSMVWPPAMAQPASPATCAPPWSTWPRIAMSRPSAGQAVRLTANSGRPPMAYTSDSALAAAIRPQSHGSSTIGVKKSVVSTSARSSSRRMTAASSPSAAPMSRSPSALGMLPMVANSASSLASGSLHAQPAPGDSEVRRGVWAWSVVTSATVRDGVRLPGGDGDVAGPGDGRVAAVVHDRGVRAGLQAGQDEDAAVGVGVKDLLEVAALAGVDVVQDGGLLAGDRGPGSQLLADRAVPFQAFELLDAEHGLAVRSNDGPAPLVQRLPAAGPGDHRLTVGQDVRARGAGVQQADRVIQDEREVLAVRGPGQRVGVHTSVDHAAAAGHALGAGAEAPGPFGPGGQVEHVELLVERRVVADVRGELGSVRGQGHVVDRVAGRDVSGGQRGQDYLGAGLGNLVDAQQEEALGGVVRYAADGGALRGQDERAVVGRAGHPGERHVRLGWSDLGQDLAGLGGPELGGGVGEGRGTGLVFHVGSGLRGGQCEVVGRDAVQAGRLPGGGGLVLQASGHGQGDGHGRDDQDRGGQRGGPRAPPGVPPVLADPRLRAQAQRGGLGGDLVRGLAQRGPQLVLP